MKYKPGDQVYWIDPDNNACSKYGVIKEIKGEIIILDDGTECLEDELIEA